MWENIAEVEKAKRALKEVVIFLTKFPQLFKGRRKPQKGILLYGPPGTWKSFLAKETATKKHKNYFSVIDANIIIQIQGIRNDEEDILILVDTNIPQG